MMVGTDGWVDTGACARPFKGCEGLDGVMGEGTGVVVGRFVCCVEGGGSVQPCNKEGEVFWPPVSTGTGVVGQEGLHSRAGHLFIDAVAGLCPWCSGSSRVPPADREGLDQCSRTLQCGWAPWWGWFQRLDDGSGRCRRISPCQCGGMHRVRSTNWPGVDPN